MIGPMETGPIEAHTRTWQTHNKRHTSECYHINTRMDIIKKIRFQSGQHAKVRALGSRMCTHILFVSPRGNVRRQRWRRRVCVCACAYCVCFRRRRNGATRETTTTRRSIDAWLRTVRAYVELTARLYGIVYTIRMVQCYFGLWKIVHAFCCGTFINCLFKITI